jgi:cytochrome c5
LGDLNQSSVNWSSVITVTAIAIAAALFTVLGVVGELNRSASARDDPEYQATVLENIRPFGRVAITGQSIEEDVAMEVAAAEPAAEVMSGPQVYNTACIACHGTGIAGAPATGDVAAWLPRIAQGSTLLNEHALQGMQGAAGYMPPKGGRVDLSDEEIIAAVDFIVLKSQ